MKHTDQMDNLKSIERPASVRDMLLRQVWAEREMEAMGLCKTRARELNLSYIKVILAEYNFDGTRLIFLFNSDTEERVDVKSLRQDMQRKFPNTQVELRQVGPRDMAKMIGAWEPVGLKTAAVVSSGDLNSISIRMAKEQGISLTPTEITGICGRLRCAHFMSTIFTCRRVPCCWNWHVMMPLGEGKVVDTNPLKQTILVELPVKQV